MKIAKSLSLFALALACSLQPPTAAAVSAEEAARQTPEGLVLWNQLGSAEEVQNSCIGSNVLAYAGTFVPGVFGNALKVDLQNTPAVTFPNGLLPRSAGCIEFWAKVAANSTVFSAGPSVILVGYSDAGSTGCGESFSFNPNDGSANGGLCARLGNIGSAGTGAFGYWTYASALKGGSVAEWHHYALVWSVDPIPTLTSPARHMAVYVDGALNTGSWIGEVVPPGPLALPENGKLNFLYLQNSAAASAVIDNVKVWSYAKTDFSDRFDEGAGSVAFSLTVSGARGNASPANGTHTYAKETALTATVPSPVTDGATRYVCTGATVSGNDFAQNGTTNVTLTLTNSAALTWYWQTQYQLATAVSGGGSVAGGGWYAAGARVTLTATASPGYRFSGWSDGEAAATRTVTVPAGGVSYTARFLSESGGSAGNLIFWNRLGSAEEVQNSSIGSNALGYAGTFVPGVFGNALKVDAQKSCGASFPNGLLPRSAGCIEFWAQAAPNSTTLSSGPSVILVGYSDAGSTGCGENLSFNPNDGSANGGLCARLSGIGSAGTGTHGYWTYANALKGGAVAEWHHYALVWSVDTIPALTSPAHHMAVYVDGALNTGSWIGEAASPSPFTPPENGKLNFLYLQNSAAASAVIDNVKIWNFAKTDFSDRFDESSGAAPCLLTVAGARGDASPTNGVFALARGSAVSASVPSPVTDGATRYLCTGAAVAGNAFALSGATNVTLTLTNNATLTWSWQTQYRLAVTADGSGSVSGDGWYAAGAGVALSATATEGYRFSGWSDGETAATRTVSVPEGGAAYTAIFSPLPRGVLRFKKAAYSVSENAGFLKLTVERAEGSYGAATVDCSALGGTAVGGADFAFEATSLYWGNGVGGDKSVYVEVTDDLAAEGNEVFELRLSEASGAALGSPAAATVTIIDNEGSPARTPRFAGSLDFGEVATNAVAVRTVELWNDGNQPLSVTNVWLTAGFSVTQQVFSVAAGEAVTLAVAFAPTALGAYSGTLVIGCNATTGTSALALTGVGVLPPTVAGTRRIAGLTARLTLDVPNGATALGVEDQLTPGLIPLAISDGGSWDAVSRKVKWFFNEPGQIRDRVLQYTVDRTGAVLAGTASFGSSSHPITGDTIFAGGENPGLLHPADDNGDWRVVLDEAAACVTRWKAGIDDYKTPVVVRGITLYLQGELYGYNASAPAEAKRWVPLITQAAAAAPKAALSAPAPLPGAVRTAQGTNVTITVTPEPGTTAWGLDESVPAGVQVTAISDDGTWDALHRKIKWIFSSGESKALSYSFTGTPGTNVTVCGNASFDGSDSAVTGAAVVAVPLSFQSWAAQRGLVGTQEELFGATNAEHGQPNGLVYALQSNLRTEEPLLSVQWIDGRPVIECPRQDAATASCAEVQLVGTSELTGAEWVLVLAPSADQTGVPAHRCRWEPATVPPKAFFRLKAILK